VGVDPLNRAVFLDRDGVLNDNVQNPANGLWESPHRPEDFRLKAGVIDALHRLQAAGFLLFVVSNQPSYAKGKTTLENIMAISGKLATILEENGIRIERYFYCLHHPEFSGPCVCRKPSPFFLNEAARDFNIALPSSWMIGDRDTDIMCGQAAGCRTILVRADHPSSEQAQSQPDFVAEDLKHAVEVVLMEAEVRKEALLF
jgi:D-glycero-D-manno-heptose 1,7-bisphosphate phosphatase